MVAIVSSLVAKELEEKMNIKVISLPSYDKLDTPVSTHADMLVSIIDDHIFIYDDYYSKNKSIFSSLEEKYKIVRVKKECSKKYPNDIALNVLIIGKRIFARLDNIAKEIIDYANNNGYKLINISQGYSACSTLVIGDNGALTADKGVYKALINEGINVLLVSNTTIKLSGYDCGFVGGAGCVYENKVMFFGEIEKHPDFIKIDKFLNEQYYSYLSILSGDVCDFGGMKLLKIE